MEMEFEKPLKGIIHMIHGLAAPYTRKEMRILRKQSEHESNVMKLGKRKKGEGVEPPISFTNKDLSGV